MVSSKNLVLIIASTGVFFEALDIAIINLAMPLIQQEFSLTADTVQWLQTLYVLIYGGFLIIGGKVSDLAGRKIVFISGSALFLITSLGAGLSPSFAWLAGFRALQGLAAALMMPSAMAIITNTFTESRERSKAIGIFSAFAAIGSGSGLSIGGIIATYWGWQWIFFINVPAIILTIILASLFIHDDSRKSSGAPIDLFSGILLTGTLLMLTFLVHDLAKIWEQVWQTMAILAATCMCGSWFIYRITHQKVPFIDLSLLSQKVTITGNVVFLLLGAVFSGYLFTISIVLQQQMHFSAAQAGLLLFPFSLLSAVVAKILVPWLLKRVRVVTVGIIGMLVMLIGAGTLWVAVVYDYPLLLVLISVSCVTGSGIAICFTSLTLMTVQGISEQHHGLAASIGTTSYFTGAGLGLSVIALFIQFHPAGDNANLTAAIVLCVFALSGVLWLLLYRYGILWKKSKRMGLTKAG